MKLINFTNGSISISRAIQVLTALVLIGTLTFNFGDEVVRAAPWATDDRVETLEQVVQDSVQDDIEHLESQIRSNLRQIKQELRRDEQEENEIIWCIARTPPDATPLDYCDLPARPSQEGGN